MTLAELLCQHGAASLDKQEALADVIGNLNWQADMAAGTLTFGGRHRFSVQLLGTESFDSQTWLWAWAGGAEHLPDSVLTAARQLRAVGMDEGIAEFVEPELALGELHGHGLSMVACGVCDADAYYRAPFAQGAAFFLVTCPELRAETGDSYARMPRIINTFLSQFPCEHRAALRAYAAYKGFAYYDLGRELVGSSPAGVSFRATFDAAGRMEEMHLSLEAADAPPVKPWWKTRKDKP